MRSIQRILLFAVLFFLLTASARSAPGDRFVFTDYPAPGLYGVDDPVTFRIEARNASNELLTDFNDPVTVGLYDPATLGQPEPTLADPRAEIGVWGNAFTGTASGAAVTFRSGVFTAAVTFKTGSDGESFLVRHASISDGNFMGQYQVTGFLTGYWAVDADNNDTPAVFPLVDRLTTTSAEAVGAVREVPIPGAATPLQYVISDVIGGYSYGGADLSADLWSISTSGSPVIQYEVILDYNGNLSDYGAPLPTEDTVYTGVFNPSASYGNYGSDAALNGAFLPLDTQTGMTGGKVILRVWNTGISPGAASLRIRAATSAESSSVHIPYSDENVLPVQGEVEPRDILVNQAVTLRYLITNRTTQDIGETRFLIPANPGGAGTPWTLSGVDLKSGAVVSSSGSPSGVSPGWVTIDWLSSPIAVGTSATVTLRFDPSTSEAAERWDFPFDYVRDTVGGDLTFVDTGAWTRTLNRPSAPASIGTQPLDIDAAGGSFQVDWAPVTTQNADGYVLSRRTPSGTGTWGVVAEFTSNTVTTHTDAGLTNMLEYEYQVVAKNPAGQSDPVTTGPVTAYVNLPAPSGPSAFSAGGAVSLAWNAVTAGPSNFPVAGYEVYRGTALGSYGPTPVATPSTTNWVDNTVSDGTRYFYVIRAVDTVHQGSDPAGIHESQASLPVQGYPPGQPPTGLSGSYSSATTTIGLSWNAPAGNVHPVTGYVVYRGVSAAPSTGGVPWTVVGAAPASLTDNDSINFGDFYAYIVGAVDSTGVTSNLSSTATVYVKPSAPIGLAATGLAASITLTWNPVLSQGVTQYRVYRDGAPVTNLAGASTGGWLDPAVLQGVDYEYSVTSFNTGGESDPSAPVTGARLPLAPTSLSAQTGTDHAVTLTWSTPEGNATGADILRNTVASTAGATTIAAGTSSSGPYIDTVGLTVGTTYYYYVRFLNPGGAGGFSPVASTMLPPSSPVLAPLALSGTDGVVLSWTQPPGELLDRFEIFSAQGAGSFGPTPVSTPGGTASSVTLSGQPRGQWMTYRMTGVNAGGSSTPSNSVSLVVPPSSPPAPTAASGTNPGSAVVSLSWAANPLSEGVTSYLVYRRDFPAGVFSLLGETSAPATLDSSVSDGAAYEYFVQAVANATGSVTLSAPAAAVTAYRMPNTPAGLVAIPGNGSVSISWSSVTATTYPVVSYQLFREISTPVPTAVPVTTVAGTNFEDVGRTNGTTYHYVVRAVDDQGHVGAASAPVSEMPVVPPQAPATVVASNGDEQILLYWSASVAGTRPVSLYIVSSAPVSIGPYSAAATVAASQRWYVDDTPSNGVTLHYRVAAVDNSGSFAGTHQGAPSAPVSAGFDIAYVNPPTGLMATAAGTTLIRLSWTAPVTLGKTLSAIEIYRSASADGPWDVLIASVPPTSVSYEDSAGLTPGATYYYVVRSVEQGTGTRSDNSNVAEAATDLRTRPIPPVGSGQAALDANLIRASSGEKLGIHFKLAVEADVRIRLYNVRGDLVAEVHYGRAPAGEAQVAEWDLRDRFGSLVSSGGYLVEITAGPLHRVLKVAVLR